jgi:Tol biopolymer transport system component
LNPAAVSPDGRRVFYYEVAPDGGRDIWFLDRESGPEPLVSGADNDRAPALSVDGRSVAFVSNATGRDEIYVTSLDARTPKRISEGGGTEPVWSRSGREILYRQGDCLMRVDAEGGPIERLFEHAFERGPGDNLANYDVQPDGQIVMIERLDRPHELRVVVNWIREL